MVRWRIAGEEAEDDIINIQEQVDDVGATAVDKQGGV